MDSTIPSRLTDLVNIGKLTANLLVEVGITTPQELRVIGPVEAWRRIQSRHPEKATVDFLFALQAALLHIPKRALPDAVKEELLDQIQWYG
jgi:DNA transformation protein and related proteins